MSRASPLSEIKPEQIVTGIREWVSLETPPNDVPRLQEFAQLASHQARQAGLSVEMIPVNNTQQPLVRIRAQSESNEKAVLVLAHYDTVHPVGTVERNRLRIDGDKMFGPGTYDMKAGAYLALQAMSALYRERQPARPVELLLVPDEESGSRLSRATIETFAREAAFALVAEPARSGGHCVTSRKGTGYVSVTAIGVPSHAGTDHAKGRSAIREIAHQALALEAMTNYREGLTLSVGRIDGGTNRNVVPERASLIADFRVVTQAQADRLLAAVKALTPVVDGVRLEVEANLNRPPFERSQRVQALFERAQRVASATGFELGEVPLTGGGSDGNFTAAFGVPTLDGLGAEGDGAHTLHEHIMVSTLPQRLAFLHGLLRDLAWDAARA
ncbi:MAG: M20 family metallopeptidase [Betaproteobacteria bacterium]|nr:M20 family metallopeptidase [Betaproteobacteria bacterium]